jgi:hypothetical protein
VIVAVPRPRLKVPATESAAIAPIATRRTVALPFESVASAPSTAASALTSIGPSRRAFENVSVPSVCRPAWPLHAPADPLPCTLSRSGALSSGSIVVTPKSLRMRTSSAASTSVACTLPSICGGCTNVIRPDDRQVPLHERSSAESSVSTRSA